MNKLTTLLVLCAVTTTACVLRPTSGEGVTAEVRRMLDAQIAAWNRGDIDAFMQSYWANPEVRFASGGNVRRGWQTVRDDYKTRYADASAMGKLTTTGLQISELGPNAAIAFGHWIVTAGGQDYCGLFTLIVRFIDGRWVIVHDHTSESSGPDALGRSCQDIKTAG